MSIRDELARIVETVAKDGLPGPRDLDVALDAIEATFVEGVAPPLSRILFHREVSALSDVREALQSALRAGE